MFPSGPLVAPIPRPAFLSARSQAARDFMLLSDIYRVSLRAGLPMEPHQMQRMHEVAARYGRLSWRTRL